ncbi:MAG: hypothetical protein WA865_12540 [Spirulinaceae cyanobacterium]
MSELEAVLEASEPTNAPPIRRVVISVPSQLPDHMRANQASGFAIREFFLIAGESLRRRDDGPEVALELKTPEGIRGDIPNGGRITLRIRKINQGNKQKVIGELRINDHQIPGYEQVNKIEFVTQEFIAQ